MTKTIDALVEALDHLRNILPLEKWADDSRLVIEAALAQARAEQAEPVDIEDLSHSAYGEAMSFGLSRELFLRYFKTIAKSPPAAPAAKLEPWQPIETAPKDGTMFLGWVSAERWSHSDGGGCGLSHDTSQIDFCRWDKGLDGNGYFDPFCGQIGDLQAVTHWIPIPPPPGEAAHNAKLGGGG